MNRSTRALHSRLLAGGAILALAVSCAGPSPATTAATPEATAAPVAAPTVAAPAQPTAATALQAQAVSHQAGTTHGLQPKRLAAVIEIDMYDHYFADLLGQQNPTFTLPVGKTVGIHFHNEGTVMHEFAIGRTPKADGGYETSLLEVVKSDVFFYYGAAKSEIGGATLEEIEIEPGLKDVWLRFTVPAELKGEWEVGCFAEDHYLKGMKAKIVFQ